MLEIEEHELRAILEEFYEQAWSCGFSEERNSTKRVECLKDVLISNIILQLKFKDF